jgi:hypothetical protein
MVGYVDFHLLEPLVEKFIMSYNMRDEWIVRSREDCFIQAVVGGAM